MSNIPSVFVGAKVSTVVCPVCYRTVPVEIPAEWSANMFECHTTDREPWITQVARLTCITDGHPASIVIR